MLPLITLTFAEFEAEYINQPESLGGKLTILDCRIGEYNKQVYLQMAVFALSRIFDGKFGVMNVDITTKDQLGAVDRFFEENRKKIIDSIPEKMDANLFINVEDNYQEELEMLK